MTITRSPYISNPDILFCHEARSTRPVALDFGEAEMLPAGTLISCEGKAVNDLTALGVLLYDVWKGYGSGIGVVLISGHVDLAKAQEHSGLTYAAEAKAALKGICFVGDTEVPSGGGGGSEYFETVGGDTLTWDGNTEGLVSVADSYFRVIETVPTFAELQNGGSITTDTGTAVFPNAQITVEQMGAQVYCINTPGGPMAIFASGDGAELEGFALQKGIYLSQACSLQINGYTGFETTKLKEEYLPSGGMVIDIGEPNPDDEGTITVADVNWKPILEHIKKGGSITINVLGIYYIMPFSITAGGTQMQVMIDLMGTQTLIVFTTP